MESLWHYAGALWEWVVNDYVIATILALIIFHYIRVFFLSRRITRLLKGGDGTSLETTIRGLDKRVARLEHTERERTRALADIERRLTRSVQGVSTERFDPFQAAGGKQSFATALLNEKGDGVVLSGIHARDGVRVYAKEVNGFASGRELSEEEERAILKVKKDLA